MMSFPKSPFRAGSRFDVSGTVGDLRLTSPGGQLLPVKNLSENIEVEVEVLSGPGGTLSSFSNLEGPKVGQL